MLMGGFYISGKFPIDRAIKALTVLWLILSLCILTACGKEVGAYQVMEEFRIGYGIERPVFSPTVAEGCEGYCYDGFLEGVFGQISDSVEDYAILFVSDIHAVGECAVLICYSTYDAISVTSSVFARLDFLKSHAGSLDTSYLEDAFVRRCGRVVIFSALPDNEKAARLFDRLI